MKVCGPQGWEFDLQWRPKGGEIDIWKPENVKFPVGCPAPPSWGKPLIGALHNIGDVPVSRYRRPLKIYKRLSVWEIYYWDLRTLNNAKRYFFLNELNKKDLPAMHPLRFCDKQTPIFNFNTDKTLQEIIAFTDKRKSFS